ncbi:hypothetical protein PG990_004564 [Apiospora arundinis]
MAWNMEEEGGSAWFLAHKENPPFVLKTHPIVGLERKHGKAERIPDWEIGPPLKWAASRRAPPNANANEPTF